ncbi:aliphatic sulfonate ABC transporter substrate-binding protein [Anaeroselena agilis]|uniref:Aliphatic sulfonate ABC transporter substrate-binding protein n=1 Tax=Anaeroselena agilis TaxID=3063788 RepID=A0ABU3NUB8_9FIRM|nr:aliphatic sulfonate ABC transporter substrate-binding protein [Selenomonadales bacterium 4137-cl]
MRNASVLVIVALLLVALATGGCGGKAATQPQGTAPGGKEIRVGIVPLPHYAHMWVAKKKGFLDEELNKAGYRLKWLPFSLGPMVSEAFAAGRLDFGVMGDFPAFIGRSAGTDYRIVAVASAAPKALAMVVKKDSPVTGVADLKGKKVATTKAAYGQKLLQLLLEKNGMTTKDIQFIHMSMDDLATALMRGDVDAGVMWDPLLTRMEEAGEVRVIADGTGIYEAYAVLMASGATVDKEPAAVDAVLKAFRRGEEYLRKNPEECTGLLLEDMRMPRPLLTKVVGKFNYSDRITDRFVVDMKDTEAFMRKNGLLKNPVAVEAFVRRK